MLKRILHAHLLVLAVGGLVIFGIELLKFIGYIIRHAADFTIGLKR